MEKSAKNYFKRSESHNRFDLNIYIILVMTVCYLIVKNFM